MKDLSRERIKQLAEVNNWSIARAEGFIDGDTLRRRGEAPSKYAQIGIDEYCLGFRAGYYDRSSVVPAPVLSSKPGLPIVFRQSAGRS